jgi:hypothetical protein
VPSTTIAATTTTAHPEQGIIDDSASVNRIYRDAMNQQMTSDPFIRTRDIPNVYDSSILTLPYGGGYR